MIEPRTDGAERPIVSIRGTNQSGMRAQNERVVLSLLRRHGALSKSEIARATGLSAQTVSVIMRALEQDGLLLKCPPVRGRVGQPTVPMRLAADGAYFFGLKIGRKSIDLVLIDFLGQMVARVHATHAYPTPDAVVGFVAASVNQLAGQLDAPARDRIAGLGIAMPFRIWDWARSIGVPEERMAAWRDIDIAHILGAELPYPVFMRNDASAACGAELVFGDPDGAQDFLYFYVGYFVGGGLVLNGALFVGRSGNAGAVGSTPVPDGRGGVGQLIDVASLSRLERMLDAAGAPSDTLWQPPGAWAVERGIVDAWVDAAAPALAFAIASAASVVDVEAALVDGWLPADVRAALVAATDAHLAGLNLAGIARPVLREGSVGPDARALGAASLPLSERFLTGGQAVPPAPR